MTRSSVASAARCSTARRLMPTISPSPPRSSRPCSTRSRGRMARCSCTARRDAIAPDSSRPSFFGWPEFRLRRSPTTTRRRSGGSTRTCGRRQNRSARRPTATRRCCRASGIGERFSGGVVSLAVCVGFFGAVGYPAGQARPAPPLPPPHPRAPLVPPPAPFRGDLGGGWGPQPRRDAGEEDRGAGGGGRGGGGRGGPGGAGGGGRCGQGIEDAGDRRVVVGGRDEPGLEHRRGQ